MLSIKENAKYKKHLIILGNNLGREDSNLRMAVPKTAALPLGDAPFKIYI